MNCKGIGDPDAIRRGAGALNKIWAVGIEGGFFGKAIGINT